MYDPTSDDALSAAMNPAVEAPINTNGEFHVFGQILTSYDFVRVAKGVRREPFDSQIHDVRERKTEIKIDVVQLPSSRLKKDVSRTFLAEWGSEWPKFALPSLKDLGLDLRTVNERYGHVVMVKTGEKYTKDGQEREKTAPKFVEVFADESACEAAEQEFMTGLRNQAVTEQAAAPSASTVAQGVATAPADDGAEREAARKFLPTLLKMAGGDAAKFAAILERQPKVSRYFPIDSPEVVALLTGEAA